MGGHRISIAAIATERFWQVAALTAAGAIGVASHAEAALYYWSDYEPGFSQARPAAPQRRQRVRHHQASKVDAPAKESAKPQGPLIIAISIDKQILKIYDANGFFAETPISTGMKGHPTPMGVFSIIQKHKLHHSNIYSGAPMPYMQRITWSGVAMHAGVLPGYPASHGCIRMPLAFATKMWGWTKMGARVVVTPGDMTPAKFSHPLLAEQKVVPQPAAAADAPKAEAPPAAKADKAADADPTRKPVTSEASLELRSTVGHDGDAKPVMDETPAATPLREQTHTADASSAMPATNTSPTMSDAASSAPRTVGSASSREEAAAPAGNMPLVAANAASAMAGDASKAEAKPDETASSADKAVESKTSEAATAEIKPAETEIAHKTERKPAEPAVSAQASGEAVKTEASASATPDEAKIEAKADDAKTETQKTEAPKAGDKAGDNPAESVKAATDARPAAPDVKKDQTRLPNTEKTAVSKPEPPKRTGQISAFISRKDGKLYVRQNFAPLFDVPVTIAPGDRPLGTHVFTAQVDKDDANVLHWSVVSLPSSRYTERRDDDERVSRRRKTVGAAEMKPMPVPSGPAEALDRLTIPADAMARIAEALSSGGSIVVSDQGIAAGETGEGTDFIVSLR